MSAWIVSKNHIDALVAALIANCRGFRVEHEGAQIEVDNAPETANKLGRLLWTENHRSVNACYHERAEPPAYTYAETAAYSAGAVAKLVHCYSYQTCEHDGWATSAARELMFRLCYELVETLPDYDAAPWGV